ncbi:blue copper protein 1a-like [Lotus japonicus]|uniref:blue copper protein 1a-like n=1 Tax=Lotus japonicus TaxID=34305 RepID=UPI00258A242A|nr:blue copper protein 1a-like [Lotus japonicus]
MALSRALILVALTATIFSTVAVAKDFVVGDDNGWTTWFDYKAWAANKVFRVGDTLTFKYPAWKDNVIRVNGTDFVKCSVPSTAQVWSSGHDTIVLTSSGRRWYISGVGDHCKSGQKLVIIVLPPEAAWSPSPSPVLGEVALTPTPAPAAVLAEVALTPAPAPAPWTAPVTVSAEVVLTPAPAPAPWTATVSHFGRWKPKKLFKIFQ